MQDPDQFLHVSHVQADGRLVEYVERVLPSCAVAATSIRGNIRTHFGQLGDQLDALRLAAR